MQRLSDSVQRKEPGVRRRSPWHTPNMTTYTATSEDEALARRAGVPLDVMLAIRANESGGSVRAVRFEPHVFHRRTGSRYLSEVPGSPREVSHVRSETNRAAFERARRYDEANAIGSTSWGAYQVLGDHLRRLYPDHPVEAFDANPEKVGREMFVEWMRRNPAARQAAQRRDIAALARRYNGSTRWAERVSAILSDIQRQGMTIAKTKAPYILGAVLLLGASGAFAVWSYLRSRS